MKRSAGVVVSGVIAGLMLVGCSPAVQGGDTKCKDFITQDEKKQNDEIAKMLKDRGNSEATGIEISASRTSVALFCNTLAKPDAKISEAPHF